MFQLDIAWLLEVALFASGLVLLHFARQASAPLLRAGAWVLLVGSLSGAACSIYFGLRYRAEGAFDHAYPPHGMMPHEGGAGSMMGPGMMPAPGSPQPGMRSAPSTGGEGGTSEEHEGHHPDKGGS